MDFLKRFLRNKKSLYNALTVLFIGVLLIVMSSSLFKSGSDTKYEKIQKSIVTDNGNNSNNSGSGSEYEAYSKTGYEKELEEELEKTLSMVDGVGRIKVMITTSEGYENVLKNDSKTEKYEESGSTRAIDEEKTVLSDDGSPIILKEIKPKIEGIIVVAEGGDNVLVKNSLINAIKALLGVEAHKIEILKMK